MKILDTVIAHSLPLLPRALVGHFAAPYVAGETEEQALAVVAELNGRGLRATIDVLGEHVTDAGAARAVAAAYCRLLDAIARDRRDANVSLKLTALGLKLERKLCVDNLRSVLGCAARHGNFVRIDMEDSSCTDDTLAIYYRIRGEFPDVGVVLQASLKRTLDDARELARVKASVRVCKGIYIESPQIAFRDRERVRESFLATVEVLLEGGGRVGIATHDDVLVEASYGLLRDRKLDPASGRYEFQMLLGVRPQLRDAIRLHGHPLRVYVPFGPDWYAYSIRRLRENPAIAGHVLRAVLSGGRG